MPNDIQMNVMRRNEAAIKNKCWYQKNYLTYIMN